MQEKISITKTLLGKTLFELQHLVSSLGLPSYTAKQIADWIYKKNIDDIQQMSNLSQKVRQRLIEEGFSCGKKAPLLCQTSKDGTKKYLFQTSLGNYIEAVYIPEKDRATLCVSSQSGCKMNCLFCMTGKQGFQQHLSCNEILNQIYAIPEHNQLTNIVFMGMGEPLDNYDELQKSLNILCAEYAIAWSPKRITVSSIGLIPNLKKYLSDTKCHLAISLHSPFAQERTKLMPIEKVYPIEEVMELIAQYDFSHQRRVSFEYILFKGINDSEQHAYALASLLKRIPCRINLIPFHPIPVVNLEGSSYQEIENFKRLLEKKGLVTTIRSSRGLDIDAACGMLSTIKKQTSLNPL